MLERLSPLHWCTPSVPVDAQVQGSVSPILHSVPPGAGGAVMPVVPAPPPSTGAKLPVPAPLGMVWLSRKLERPS